MLSPLVGADWGEARQTLCSPGAAPPEGSPPRTTLVLDDLLPVASASLRPQCEAIRRLLSVPIGEVICHERPSVGLHPSNDTALPHLVDWKPEGLWEIKQWCIFVDGSRADRGSGCGLTIVAYRAAPPHV